MAEATAEAIAHARDVTITECQEELGRLAAEHEAKAQAYREAAKTLGMLRGGRCACSHLVSLHTLVGCKVCACVEGFAR